MFLSGIADEAGCDLTVQLKAHKELGWNHIELRYVSSEARNVKRNIITDVTDEEFDAIRAMMDEAGMKVSCFASAIANWARKITDPFERDVDELKRSIPRMKSIGTPFIRVMSWINDNLEEPAWHAEAVRRMRELAKIAEDGGVVIVVENCDGWSSTSAENSARFLEEVDSPAVKALYDTGNPAQHGHTNTWEWYQAVKDRIAYVHIKSHTGPSGWSFAWPDGSNSASMIPETVKDLLAGGYDGGFSIEPHLNFQPGMLDAFRAGREMSDAEASYQMYVEYGRRMIKIVKQAKV